MEAHRVHHQSNLRAKKKDILSKPLLRPLGQQPGTPLVMPLTEQLEILAMSLICLQQATLWLGPPPPACD